MVFAVGILVVVILIVFGFCVFFDQALFNRRETIYRVPSAHKKIAITFDDGPSPEWTPLILDELKKVDVKATFFMIGYHVKKYPDIAKRVAQEGHTIANHGYAHSVILYYTPAEIEEEIKYTEHVIKEATGQTTKYFRPPKSWISPAIKEKVKSMGYEVVLWSLNSKDWVMFPFRWIVWNLSQRLGNGDIVLFHDSGNIRSMEGGNRMQTVKAIGPLVQAARAKGFEFVSLKELIGG